MHMMLKYFVLTSLIGFGKQHVLPEEKCNLQDSKCMTAAIQKAVPIFMNGIPELGVESLDVMEMDYVAFNMSGLQFTLKDGRLKGLKDSVIENVKWDLEKKRIEIDLKMNSTVKGHYTAGGQIIILPISGDGQMKLTLKNIQTKLYLDYEVKKYLNGNHHIVPTGYKFDFDVKGGAHFNLTNLFNGNRAFSSMMLVFLNENWKLIVSEFGTPIMDASAKKIYKNVATFFHNMSIEDISLNKFTS